MDGSSSSRVTELAWGLSGDIGKNPTHTHCFPHEKTSQDETPGTSEEGISKERKISWEGKGDSERMVNGSQAWEALLVDQVG